MLGVDTILLRVKGWREGATLASILPTAFGMALPNNAKHPTLSQEKLCAICLFCPISMSGHQIRLILFLRLYKILNALADLLQLCRFNTIGAGRFLVLSTSKKSAKSLIVNYALRPRSADALHNYGRFSQHTWQYFLFYQAPKFFFNAEVMFADMDQNRERR
jgi:hypothetical protein